MHRYLGFEESLESPTDRESHQTSYLGWQPDQIRVPFQLRTLSTLLEGLPPWLLSAPYSVSTQSRRILSLADTDAPSVSISANCVLFPLSITYPCSYSSKLSLASLSPDPRSSL
ncbi:hypothetical protein GOODEAATRI_013452 [Goodea atripinnis]|uniref:Uncharacterized protein n=1 Tax=Goodea atripinnis TaxID=208336 RepID=A0ABV0PDT3_9TELE